jgi:hypothetical protein
MILSVGWLKSRSQHSGQMKVRNITDLGMAGLCDGVRPGLTERELDDCIERAYVRHGAVNFIHYIGVTQMRAPGLGLKKDRMSQNGTRNGTGLVSSDSRACVRNMDRKWLSRWRGKATLAGR